MSHQIKHQEPQASDDATQINAGGGKTFNIGSRRPNSPVENIPLAQISSTSGNPNEGTNPQVQRTERRRASKGGACGFWDKKTRLYCLLCVTLLVTLAIILGIVLSRRSKNNQSARFNLNSTLRTKVIFP